MKWLVTLAFILGLGVVALAVRQRARLDAPAAATAPTAPTGAGDARGPGAAGARGPAAETGAGTPAGAAAPCPAADALPPLVAPAAWAATLTVVHAPEAVVEVDGLPAPPGRITPGRHLLVARGPGASPSRLSIEVEPFTPVLVEARAAEGAMTLLVLGARCASCQLDGEGAPLDTAHLPGTRGSRAEVSLALSAGEVSRAARAFRALPDEERVTPEPRRLLAVLHALGGDQEGAEARLATLPKTDPLVGALATRAQRLGEVPALQRETAVARWNALTERYQRLSDAFATDAPAVVSALTSRFDGLSVRFHRAQAATDGAVDVETTIDEASATLSQFVLTLRRERPADCAWQQRVSAAL